MDGIGCVWLGCGPLFLHILWRLATNLMHNHGAEIMINNKGRNSKGKVKNAHDEHTQRKTEPSTRELRRKAKGKKANTLEIEK
jgi:hypothetical protein